MCERSSKNRLADKACLRPNDLASSCKKEEFQRSKHRQRNQVRKMAETPTPKAGLPGSAVSRLRHGGGGTSAHPEANLLAAFSEQALTAPERDEVLSHLAQCADCREIVALSMPPASDIPQTAVTESRGWFGLPPEFMRWGVVGASAAIVVAAVLWVKPEMQTPELRTAGTTAAVAKPQSSAEKDLAQTQAPGAESNYYSGARPAEVGRNDSAKQGPAKGDALNDARQSSAAARQVVPMAPPPSPPRVAGGFAIDGADASNAVGGAAAGSGARAGIGKSVAGRNRSAEAPTVHKLESQPAVVADSAAKRADGESALARSDNQALAKDAGKEKAEAGDARAARSEFAQLQTFSKLGRAKLEPQKNEPAKNEAKATPAKPAESAPAAFGAVGGVVAGQSSADRTSDVATSEASASGRGMKPFRRAFNPGPTTWRVIDGQLQSSQDAGENWEVANLPAGVKALAVDAISPLSVWVGGAAGVVLRSLDQGATWTRISGGWTGDVVYLKFTDVKNGVLRTRTTEEWITADGGITWKKRPPEFTR